MTRIDLAITGTTALICHNPRLADPDDEIVKLIREITQKGARKTEEDRREIERLEWVGGLYVGENGEGPVIPTANMRKCLQNAAKVSKQGTSLTRALYFTQLSVPINYSGTRDLVALRTDPRFSLRASVGIQRSRTMRVRPRFPEWALGASVELLDDEMSVADFGRIVERAGRIEGLGDYRVGGYGRFEATVTAQT